MHTDVLDHPLAPGVIAIPARDRDLAPPRVGDAWRLKARAKARLALGLVASAIILAILAGVLLFMALLDPAASTFSTARPVAEVKDGLTLEGQPVPTVEPTNYLALTPDQARAENALIPFSTKPNPAARPFVFSGTPLDRARAATCLAAAAYYEAGDDALGEQAVIQVVLNRVRHPAFPNSVCGVVFEGSSRSTGCQFTFTCDGALNRPPQPAAWARAKFWASQALAGSVFPLVGYATHYHTDWVVPSWGPEMEKIAALHTHLFFRWPGAWGRPVAFERGNTGHETVDARIEHLVGAVGDDAAAELQIPGLFDDAPLASKSGGITLAGVSTIDLGGATVQAVDGSTHQYLIALNADAYPGSYAILALKICADQAPCRVMGWRNPADMPNRQPGPGVLPSSVSFVFDKAANGATTSMWNCRQIERANKAQCLPGTAHESPDQAKGGGPTETEGAASAVDTTTN